MEHDNVNRKEEDVAFALTFAIMGFLVDADPSLEHNLDSLENCCLDMNPFNVSPFNVIARAGVEPFGRRLLKFMTQRGLVVTKRVNSTGSEKAMLHRDASIDPVSLGS